MRDITTEMAAAYGGANVAYPALLAELEFDSAPLYMWTGLGSLVWDGKTYIGGGNLVGISDIDENQGLEATGIVVSLNGVPSNIVSLAFNESARGRPFKLYLAASIPDGELLLEDGDNLLTEDGGNFLLEPQIVSEPYRIFSGLMDTMQILDSGETSTITVTVESIMIVGQRSKVRRYTKEDQKRIYPNDKGLDFINSLQDKEIVW